MKNLHSHLRPRKFAIGIIAISFLLLFKPIRVSAQVFSADINNDGIVNGIDYDMVITAFGTTGPNIPEDVNRSGEVDIFDFSIVVTQFGTTPPPTSAPSPTGIATPTPTVRGGGASPTPAPNGPLSVDMGIEQGPVTYRATGYLGNEFSDSNPNSSTYNSYWQPLKLQLFSWIQPTGSSYNFPGLNRAIAANAYYQTKVRSPLSFSDIDKGMNSDWAIKVRGVVQAASNTGYDKLQVDIFNEPFYNNQLNSAYLLEAWRLAYDSRNQIDPNVTLAGPNVNHANGWSWLINTFLPTMNAENKLPDVITWHEINTTKTNIANNINLVRNMLDNWGHTDVQISINEYNYTNSYLQPGFGVQFMHELEKGKVQSASRACWDEPSGGGYDCVPTFNGFLTDPGGVPRSIWHTYKAYADMTGTMVRVEQGSGVTGVASKDSSLNNAHILLGRYTSSTSAFELNITNLQNTSFNTSLPIDINIYQIQNSGTSAGSANLYQQLSLTPQNNQLSLGFGTGSAYEAYHIILSQ